MRFEWERIAWLRFCREVGETQVSGLTFVDAR